MRADEKSLLEAVAGGTSPRDLWESMGMPYKRMLYLCEKWARKGWYDYGVSADLGWITEEGREEVKKWA